MQISTSKCHQFRHPEFVLEADVTQVPDSFLKNIAKTIEELVANGSIFWPDETFQIGWMTTLVRSLDSSHLTLVEPDMLNLPIKWASGLTHTLRQMMFQLYMLDSVALRREMNTPSIRQSLITCTQYHARRFMMSRSGASGESDSGWFIGSLDHEHDHNDPANLKCLSVYEAYLHQDGIHGFISFPVGSDVFVDREKGIQVFKDGEELDIQPDSYLRRIWADNGR